MTKSRFCLGYSVIIVAGAAGASSVACEPATGGREVEVELRVGGSTSASTFATASGWNVTLEEALVVVGPIVVYENLPVLARASALPRAAGWVRDLLVPPAHAHPGHGHFNGGTVRAEWMGQTVVDVLHPGLQDIAIPGVAGSAGSLTIHLQPAAPEVVGAERLEGNQVWLVGLAQRDDVILPFRGGIVIAPEGDRRKIQGVSAVGLVDEGARIDVVVNAAAWFLDVDFSELEGQEVGADGRHQIVPDGAIARSLEVGVRSLGTARETSSVWADIEEAVR